MISIITPVYNGEKYIEACIKVIIDQNCPDVEHIIVDGASTDKTVEMIKLYAEQYPHIRWISEKDQGQSDAMNKGIAMAKGEIISFLNVDDFYQPNVLNRVLEIFPSLPVPSILVGNCNVWDSTNEIGVVHKPRNFRLSSLLQGLNSKNFPANPSAYFYHKCLHSSVGFYQVDEHYAMDLDFLLRAVQVAKVTYVNETWGNWMRLENTKSFMLWQSYDRGHAVVDKVLRYYRKDLPPLQRWLITIKYEQISIPWERNLKWKLRYYVKQYLLTPKNIISKINSKLMKLLAS